MPEITAEDRNSIMFIKRILENIEDDLENKGALEFDLRVIMEVLKFDGTLLDGEPQRLSKKSREEILGRDNSNMANNLRNGLVHAYFSINDADIKDFAREWGAKIDIQLDNLLQGKRCESVNFKNHDLYKSLNKPFVKSHNRSFDDRIHDLQEVLSALNEDGIKYTNEVSISPTERRSSQNNLIKFGEIIQALGKSEEGIKFQRHLNRESKKRCYNSTGSFVSRKNNMSHSIEELNPEEVREAVLQHVGIFDSFLFILNEGPPIDNNKPLFESFSNGNRNAVREIFLEGNFDINFIDNDSGDSALHVVARKGDFRGVKKICSHPDVDINILNSKNESPLSIAEANGQEKVAGYLRSLLDAIKAGPESISKCKSEILIPEITDEEKRRKSIARTTSPSSSIIPSEKTVLSGRALLNNSK